MKTPQTHPRSGRSVQVPRAAAGPVGRRLASGPPEHQEGMAGVGPSREDATEGGGGTGRLSEVLSHGDTGGVFLWGGYLGFFGANGAESRGSSCGVPETGDKVEVKNSKGRFAAEVGGKQITSESGVTTAPNLIGQEAGDSGGMGGFTAHL